jgi:divalent metal cation (Fe/Co/Zn/Cd) transporter
VVSTVERRSLLLRRGLRLEYVTLGWNVVGIFVLAATAIAARSVALAGFGLDSAIEIFASLVVVRELDASSTPERQRRAERGIGWAFVALAIYLAGQGVVTLVTEVHPYSSPVGIAWLAATAVVMFALAYGKRITGRALDHRVLVAESKVTIVDGALATATLIGLTVNAALGWWWADVAAGVVIVGYGVREANHLLRG